MIGYARRMRRRHVGLAVALLVAGCGATPPNRGAEASSARPIPRNLIIPEQGMAGVRLRMSPEQVRAALGRPDQVRRSSESETGVPILSWRYRPTRLTVDLHKWGKRFT